MSVVVASRRARAAVRHHRHNGGRQCIRFWRNCISAASVACRDLGSAAMRIRDPVYGLQTGSPMQT
jgi:hypothetical protein